MNRRTCKRLMMVLGLLCVIVAIDREGQSQTPSAFTYQGKLSDAGAPANGQYDFEFKLFNATNLQLGATLAREDVQVTNGSFTVELDFGQSPFTTGVAKPLEIGVRPGASTGAFTTLAPRQQLTSSPYSIQTVNAQQLGGVPTDLYVKTRQGRRGGSFIQNTTTQQPSANFNIAGNGLVAGTVGIGTQTPLAGMKLDVNGAARIAPGGNGGAIQFGTPNLETGMTISNATTRADLRFDGSSLKLLAGLAGAPPSNLNGINVKTTGNVGVGTDAPTKKLHVVGLGQPAIYGESDNRGVWGVSTGSSYGVYGESTNGLGVQGVSTNKVGVAGASTSHVGVFGSTAAGDVTKPGVQGTSTGKGGVGVRGDGATGVYGRTVSVLLTPEGEPAVAGVMGVARPEAGVGVAGYGEAGVYGGGSDYGVYGRSSSGYAIYANGNAGQPTDKNGFVKALIYVRRDGAILRCYNAILNSSSGSSCAIVTLPLGSVGAYRIRFPNLPIAGRFVSITPEYATTCNVVPIRCRNAGANFAINGDFIEVFTFNADNAQDTAEAAFMLVVF